MFYKYSIVEYNIRNTKVYLVCRESLLGNKTYYTGRFGGLWCEFDDVNFYELLIVTRDRFTLVQAEKDFLEVTGIKEKTDKINLKLEEKKLKTVSR